MAGKLKELFYWWAFLDLDHTCEKSKTYFWRYSGEIGLNNLNMIRSISVFLSVISVFVITITSLFFPVRVLRELYLFIFVMEMTVSYTHLDVYKRQVLEQGGCHVSLT